ncbi:hypothetical protein PAHAL_2G481000 [Panicum hallii]|uniref:Uncharacterized protein n=1 Tax=Panicum hallii TaxID=206008 RepID=A0A2T8KT97_9POAL|nr:hypothetical protein PAHAL_2G481000 [Panicum hallii]
MTGEASILHVFSFSIKVLLTLLWNRGTVNPSPSATKGMPETS